MQDQYIFIFTRVNAFLFFSSVILFLIVVLTAFFKELSRKDYLRRLEKVRKISENIFLSSGFEKRIGKIKREATRSIDKWKRIESLLILGYAKCPGSEKILRSGLFSEDEDISYFSMLSLGRLRTKEAGAILLDFLSFHVFSGYKIVSLLEEFSSEIIPDIIRTARSSDGLTRFWAIKLLIRFPDRSHLLFVERLIRDNSADVRSAACECLG
ncbi:MAG TPA: HEAT repeat domain-containing protein, partial [Candidatus Omnitrophota bacterium]|nr:HEAT repeat domain-containing protein [Candidatus Omnitrophota bacterium]